MIQMKTIIKSVMIAMISIMLRSRVISQTLEMTQSYRSNILKFTKGISVMFREIESKPCGKHQEK